MYFASKLLPDAICCVGQLSASHDSATHLGRKVVWQNWERADEQRREGDEGAASRVFGKFTDEAVLAMHLNFAMVLYECFLYALLGKSLDLWAHHVLGIILLTLTLRSGQCGIYLAWAGISEGTSVNLSLRNLLLESGMKKSRIYVVNGLLLWLSFLVLRVLNLAVLSWRIMRDVFVVLPAARLEAEADPVLRYMDLFASVFIWALSTWWFYKITLGVIDGLRGGKKLKLEDEEARS